MEDNRLAKIARDSQSSTGSAQSRQTEETMERKYHQNPPDLTSGRTGESLYRRRRRRRRRIIIIHPSLLHISNFDLLVSFTNILTLPQSYDDKCKV
jgi:hypothetical protein